MPLQIEVETEHPDVTALKKRVKEVAERYKRRYNWCREVNQALREAGIEDNNTITVEVTFTVAGSDEQKSVVVFPISDLAGKDDEEQKQVVAEKIAPKVNVAGTTVSIPVTIVDLNESSRNAATGLNVPNGYTHFYISESGRVAHLVPLPYQVTSGQMALEEWTRQWANGRGVSAVCGEISYYPTTISARSENRVCQNCANRVGS